MKKRKFKPGEYWILVGGILLIAFAVLFFLAAAGKEKLLVGIMTGLGVVAVIAGFLIGSFAGAAAAFGIIWVLVKIMDRFTTAFAYIFLAGGIAMIIWWLVESFPVVSDSSYSGSSSSSSGSSSSSYSSSSSSPSKSSSVSSSSSASKSSSSGSSGRSAPSDLHWSDCRDRTDYTEIRIDLGDTDAEYVVFLALEVGDRLYVTKYTDQDSLGLTFRFNGSYKHFCDLEGDLLEKLTDISPEAIFVSDVSKAPGNIWIKIRCYSS
ncbi:MAG: hypothetical protein IJG67_00975 [Oscillospiraceae bacterium]|nr:hypothetical protein [Oscillospiraceae bacterium]